MAFETCDDISLMQAAFFDLDKTVIAKSSMLVFSHSFFRDGLLSRTTLIRAAYGQLAFMLVGADEAKMEKARRTALKLTDGWEQSRVRRLVTETMEEAIRPIIFSEALELFAEHRRAGRRIYIVSSAPEEVVEPLSRMLKVDDYIATRSRVVDGRYVGELDFYCYGDNKAEAIRELAEWRGFELDECYAYSDSITDVPMLEVVGHPCAVNPDRELEKVSEERNWEIRKFTETAPLDPRHYLAENKHGIAIAAGVAAIAVAVILRRFLNDTAVRDAA